MFPKLRYSVFGSLNFTNLEGSYTFPKPAKNLLLDHISGVVNLEKGSASTLRLVFNPPSGSEPGGDIWVPLIPQGPVVATTLLQTWAFSLLVSIPIPAGSDITVSVGRTEKTGTAGGQVALLGRLE